MALCHRTGTPIICTIIAKNYLPFARTLAQSFKKHHPSGRMIALLVDAIDDYFDPESELFDIVVAEDLNIPHFDSMAFRYSLLELSTAVKPFFLEYLFRQYHCEKLCYFDPDITVHAPLDEILSLLDTYFLLLTPHLLDFLEDGSQPDEPFILRAGVYNLGFLGISNRPELERFLGWWQRRLAKLCVVDTSRGLFVDQRWMDLAPGFFPDVHIHRDPGCNVAYWNLSHRQLSFADGNYRVNGSPLKFFHFSGFQVNNVEAVSKFQNRFLLGDLPGLRTLFYEYHQDLLANGYQTSKAWPYSYGFFDNNVSIPDIARYLWREQDDGKRWPTPFSTTGRKSYVSWLNASIDSSGKGRPLITNLALEAFKRRPDIQRAFPDILGHDRTRFAEWFVQQGRRDFCLDSFFTEPIRDSLQVCRPSHGLLRGCSVGGAGAPYRKEMSPHRSLPLGGRIYFTVRDSLKRFGLTQRIENWLGAKRIRKVRQIFFMGRDHLADVSEMKILPPAGHENSHSGGTSDQPSE